MNKSPCLASLSINSLKQYKPSGCGWIYRIMDAAVAVNDNVVGPNEILYNGCH